MTEGASDPASREATGGFLGRRRTSVLTQCGGTGSDAAYFAAGAIGVARSDWGEAVLA